MRVEMLPYPANAMSRRDFVIHTPLLLVINRGGFFQRPR